MYTFSPVAFQSATMEAATSAGYIIITWFRFLCAICFDL